MIKPHRIHKSITAVIMIAGLLGAIYWLNPQWREVTAATGGKGQTQQAREPGVLHYLPGAPQLAEIRIGRGQLAPLPLSAALNARLTYDESVTARVSSPVSGRVVAVPADLGDKIKAGETVLVIDSPDLGTALADAEKAVADARRKALAWQRAKKLFEGDVLARKDMESAEADWQQARAEEQRARLKLNNLRARHMIGLGGLSGESFSLVSPIAGIITERNANPGMEVRPDLAAPLFIISDPTHLWAVIDLPETLLYQVHPGQQVMLETQAFPFISFSGRISKVSPALDPATRRVSVRVTVSNPDGQLRPEMFARVSLLAGDDTVAPVLRLPATAVVTEGVAHVVFVERAPGEFVKRRVEIALQDHEFVYLASGLKADESVVQSGALLLASELAGSD